MSRPNFVYFCRYCGQKQTCDGRNLLTNYVDCINCKQKFRICDADHRAEGRFRKFDRALTHIFDQFNFFGLSTGDGLIIGGVDDEAGRFDTECVHCHAPIRTYCTVNPDGSIPVPYACRSCGRKLPGPWTDEPEKKPEKQKQESQEEFLAEGLQDTLEKLGNAELALIHFQNKVSELENLNLKTERRYDEIMKTAEGQTKQLLQELQTANQELQTANQRIRELETALVNEQDPILKAFAGIDADKENPTNFCKELYRRAVMLNGNDLDEKQFDTMLKRLKNGP